MCSDETQSSKEITRSDDPQGGIHQARPTKARDEHAC